MTYSAFMKELAKWVNSRVGADTPFRAVAVIADQNAPRPGTTSVTLRQLSSLAVGEEYVAPPDGFGASKIIRVVERTVSISALGDGALDVLEELRDSLTIDTVREPLNNAGIVFVQEESPIQNLTGLIDETSVPRGSLDLRFRVNAVTVDPAQGRIEAATGRAVLAHGPGDEHPYEAEWEADTRDLLELDSGDLLVVGAPPASLSLSLT